MTFNSVVLLVFALTAAVIDIKTQRIPNKLVLAMLGVWLLLFAYDLIISPNTALPSLADSLLGLVIGGGVFLSVYLISKKGLGGGDVKFMAAAGLYLGLGSILPAILYGTVLAALTGLVLILLKKITRKDKLPLAPFLLVGIAITMIVR